MNLLISGGVDENKTGWHHAETLPVPAAQFSCAVEMGSFFVLRNQNNSGRKGANNAKRKFQTQIPEAQEVSF